MVNLTYDEFCDLKPPDTYKPGTFMWAVEQMKQGKTLCRHDGVDDYLEYFKNDKGEIMWRPGRKYWEESTAIFTIEDFEATNWRVLE